MNQQHPGICHCHICDAPAEPEEGQCGTCENMSYDCDGLYDDWHPVCLTTGKAVDKFADCVCDEWEEMT